MLDKRLVLRYIIDVTSMPHSIRFSGTPERGKQTFFIRPTSFLSVLEDLEIVTMGADFGSHGRPS